ncbi:MAG TPA: histidine kinase [Actinomycetota bacterium]|nr:histidine kinase [Actinomycetota bacterium]
MFPAGRARLVALRPPLTDVLLAAGVLVVAQVETWMTTSFQPKPSLALLAVVMTVPLAWRRRVPFGVLLVVGGAGAVLGTGWPELNALYTFIAVVVAVFSVGAYAEPRRSVVGCALVLGWFWAGALIDNAGRPGQRGPSDFVFVTVVFGGAWLLGRALRERGQRAAELEQRAAQLEADQQVQARAAVAAERARIARELHDVIAHSVSVMVIQAGAAEQLLEDTPERARGPLEAVQDTGRQTILELRRLLGILREDSQELSLAPQPGLAGLELLMEEMRLAGLLVQLRVEGQPGRLPPGIDLAAYRIIQEALTNTLRHAGPAHAEVLVRYQQHAVELEVLDDGHGPGPNNGASGASGHGLVGMRERVALYGGTLEAGPRTTTKAAGTGYAVRARLPTEAGAT